MFSKERAWNDADENENWCHHIDDVVEQEPPRACRRWGPKDRASNEGAHESRHAGADHDSENPNRFVPGPDRIYERYHERSDADEVESGHQTDVQAES